MPPGEPQQRPHVQTDTTLYGRREALSQGRTFPGVNSRDVFGGCALPFHFGVYVSGHFNDLAAGAFLPPPRSPPLPSH